MEQRLASNAWRMTLNERKFIEAALASDLRVDGRRPFDYRNLTIHFGRDDGSSEVHLGETHVMGYVTAQLVQPYRDRPNEGTLSIFTEFSPMADPSFEPGRPGEFAIELGRVIDRGLRESKAVDMESLCVVTGKSVWSIRLDLHILDNGGNLIDAANIAALAALLTFRRPECTLGGENSQEVIIHDPEIRDPLPLIIHHLPVAVTFAFFGEGNTTVIDPTYKEEVVMGGRMTVTLNSNGDVCAIQKAGGEGVISSVIMQCLRIASMKAAEISSKIKSAADDYNMERALQKVKRHQSSTGGVIVPDIVRNDNRFASFEHQTQMLENEPQRTNNQVDNMAVETSTSLTVKSRGSSATAFVGGPSNWDPYSNETLSRFTRSSPDSLTADREEISRSKEIPDHPGYEQSATPNSSTIHTTGASGMTHQSSSAPKSLKDAVKLKGKKK